MNLTYICKPVLSLSTGTVTVQGVISTKLFNEEYSMSVKVLIKTILITKFLPTHFVDINSDYKFILNSLLPVTNWINKHIFHIKINGLLQRN